MGLRLLFAISLSLLRVGLRFLGVIALGLFSVIVLWFLVVASLVLLLGLIVVSRLLVAVIVCPVIIVASVVLPAIFLVVIVLVFRRGLVRRRVSFCRSCLLRIVIVRLVIRVTIAARTFLFLFLDGIETGNALLQDVLRISFGSLLLGIRLQREWLIALLVHVYHLEGTLRRDRYQVGGDRLICRVGDLLLEDIRLEVVIGIVFRLKSDLSGWQFLLRLHV